MQESIRRTLLETKVIDIEVEEDLIIFYLENEHGACYAVNIKNGECDSVLLYDAFDQYII